MKECKFCGLKFKLVKSHELFCKLNPQRIKRKGTNQFTKYPDYKVSDETKRKLSDSARGQLWSEEQKRKHSLIMKRAVKNNPESYSSSNVCGRVKKYTFNGMTFTGKWELDVAKSLHSNNIRFTNIINPFEYIWEDGVHLYFPDFYLLDHDIYIEVKGYKRERDICKWGVVKNLLVITKSEIKNINDKEFWTTFLKR